MNAVDRDPVDGFLVVSPSGRKSGVVVGVTEDAVVVRMRRLGRSVYRPLPRECALVWERNRTVVAQLSARELRGAPALSPDGRAGEAAPLRQASPRAR